MEQDFNDLVVWMTDYVRDLPMSWTPEDLAMDAEVSDAPGVGVLSKDEVMSAAKKVLSGGDSVKEEWRIYENRLMEATMMNYRDRELPGEQVDLPKEDEIDPGLLEKVAQATSWTTHDDPNAVGRIYRSVRHYDLQSMSDDDFADVGSVFLSLATNVDGVSDNDGETPRMTPDEFTDWSESELGRAVMQHFSK